MCCSCWAKRTVPPRRTTAAPETDMIKRFSAKFGARLCTAVLLSLWVMAPLRAGDAEAIPWDSLNAAEQHLLAPLSEQWDSLPPERQARLRSGARRWQNASPEEQERAKQRFEQWRELPPEHREELRERYQRFKTLPPEKQARIRDQYRWMGQLPPDIRDGLRNRLRELPPSERRQALYRLEEIRQLPEPRQHQVLRDWLEPQPGTDQTE